MAKYLYVCTGRFFKSALQITYWYLMAGILIQKNPICGRKTIKTVNYTTLVSWNDFYKSSQISYGISRVYLKNIHPKLRFIGSRPIIFGIHKPSYF